MALVVVCGAAGGIGQPLSLLLKQSDLISHLALYDIVNAAGVAADLSHINTASKVTGHGKDALPEALHGAHTVVIPAGVPRKPGMTRDDLFKVKTAAFAPVTRTFCFVSPPCVYCTRRIVSFCVQPTKKLWYDCYDFGPFVLRSMLVSSVIWPKHVPNTALRHSFS